MFAIVSCCTQFTVKGMMSNSCELSLSLLGWLDQTECPDTRTLLPSNGTNGNPRLVVFNGGTPAGCTSLAHEQQLCTSSRTEEGNTGKSYCRPFCRSVKRILHIYSSLLFLYTLMFNLHFLCRMQSHCVKITQYSVVLHYLSLEVHWKAYPMCTSRWPNMSWFWPDPHWKGS